MKCSRASPRWRNRRYRTGWRSWSTPNYSTSGGVRRAPNISLKHALVQDAAYASLLRSTRQAYHQQVARMLEVRFPETIEAEPELVAHHYTETGCHEQAVDYWQHAGQRAVQRSANVEAIAHLRQGIELLATLPDTSERTQQELTFHTTLGPALMATKGYGAPEVGQVYSRARELCPQVGETPELFTVLWGMWLFY